MFQASTSEETARTCLGLDLLHGVEASGSGVRTAASTPGETTSCCAAAPAATTPPAAESALSDGNASCPNRRGSPASPTGPTSLLARIPRPRPRGCFGGESAPDLRQRAATALVARGGAGERDWGDQWPASRQGLGALRPDSFEEDVEDFEAELHGRSAGLGRRGTAG